MRTLEDVGIRSHESATLARYLTDIENFLGTSRAQSQPSRAHPVIRRVTLSTEDYDPVSEFSVQLETDGAVTSEIRKHVSTVLHLLHGNSQLTQEQWNSLGVSMIMVRIYLSWKLGFIDSAEKENAARDLVVNNDALIRAGAQTWLWAGLILSRILGESLPDDPDFGL
jgi:hypothetical protein